MRPFDVTVVRWHHSSYWVFNLKTFPKYRVCFLVLGKSKREVGNFWRSLLFNHFWGSCSCPVLGRDSYISSCCCFWNSLKVENKSGKQSKVSFCSLFSKHYPTVKCFNTYWVLFMISTFLVWIIISLSFFGDFFGIGLKLLWI